ncbi:MAG: hypothetical protein U0871_27450 [Gemmataceae bacterium]
MLRRQVVFGLFVLATLTLTFFARRSSTNPELPPSGQGAVLSVTHDYWVETGRSFRGAGRAEKLLDEQMVIARSGKLTTSAELKVFSERMADLYRESVQHCQRAVVEIERRSVQGVDPLAVAVATEAVNYLRVRINLHRDHAGDSGLYARLYADIEAAGGEIDPDTPEGKRFLEREEENLARIKARHDGDGRKERELLDTVLAHARQARLELVAKYNSDFPDFNSPAK